MSIVMISSAIQVLGVMLSVLFAVCLYLAQGEYSGADRDISLPRCIHRQYHLWRVLSINFRLAGFLFLLFGLLAEDGFLRGYLFWFSVLTICYSLYIHLLAESKIRIFFQFLDRKRMNGKRKLFLTWQRYLQLRYFIRKQKFVFPDHDQGSLFIDGRLSLLVRGLPYFFFMALISIALFTEKDPLNMVSQHHLIVFLKYTCQLSVGEIFYIFAKWHVFSGDEFFLRI